MQVEAPAAAQEPPSKLTTAEASAGAIADAPLPISSASPATASLPAGTRLELQLEDNVTSVTNKPGDTFRVTVLKDVVSGGTVVIPAGTFGRGAVTFVTNRGDFGKPGILSMEMRELQVGDRTVPVSGRYREEGQSKNGATAATFFAVGIFAGFIKGKAALIEKGRELHAATVGDFTFTPGAPPPAIVIPEWAKPPAEAAGVTAPREEPPAAPTAVSTDAAQMPAEQTIDKTGNTQ